MKILSSHFLYLGLILVSTGCVSWDQSVREEPVVVSSVTPLKELIHVAMNQGQEYLTQAKEIIVDRAEVEACGDYLFTLLQGDSKLTATQLVNGLNLYLFSGHKKAPELFYHFSQSYDHVHIQLSWYLAAKRPSAKMGEMIEKVVSGALARSSLKNMYMPAMADAISNNKLTDLYTVVRQGLFETNHIQFVNAMMSLNPEQASSDFMFYLSKAPLQELRQLNLKTLDLLVCSQILSHLQAFPPEISHPKFDKLFHFAISRNIALSEHARRVLDVYIPEKNNHLAILLARLPNWVQIAFIEGSRRNLNPQLSLFLRELKKTSSQREVVEEIDHVVR